MTEYLITFNDEWVPPHTAEQIHEKGTAAALDWPQEVHRFRGPGEARRNGSEGK
ncbi:hypothetical protein [Micromonospora parathelypteridis]|uniref:Uncharacterized protein n=1 Tax=Micromonospora parathelypteridis TaxID=1839617 RepID=A0A840W4K7_9ACTN|nr:hypothetical protein [Micromonospora parathelypteridis]MBB5480038.1 hypothetical protein [Micromonospora parathelypteridis]GGO25330.1 hypothetical protein GCM10011576_47750 [Micromonospora parathelypteridis]